VAAHPDLAQWQIAEHFGISSSRLSVLTCSPAGQRYLNFDLDKWLEASGLVDEEGD